MSAPAKWLIVNADDFGRSTGINDGVAQAHERGIVTSASLMVRRPAAEQAAEYARRHPELSVGLHVDLGEWAYRGGEWVALDRVEGSVESQAHAQLTRFETLRGRAPTHIDSHQHVHREPEIGEVLVRMASELGVPLRGFDAAITYCGAFYGQTATGEALHDAISVDALISLLSGLPDGITELGCHPGAAPDEDFPYGRERATELGTLTDERIYAAVARAGIQLCSFADISSRRGAASANG